MRSQTVGRGPCEGWVTDVSRGGWERLGGRAGRVLKMNGGEGGIRTPGSV